MQVQRSSILAFVFLISVALGVSAAPAQQFPDPPDGVYEFVSAGSGPWHNPATWGQVSAIPGTGDDVLIQSGHLVTIQRQEPARHRLIHVEGEFRLWIHGTTRLFVETLYVSGNGPGTADDGIFMIGAVSNPVKPGKKAEVVFTSSGAIDLGWDAKQASRGLVSDGRVRLFGQAKTHVIPVDQDLLAGDDHFLLEPPHGGWQAGDEIVIAGTYFQRVGTETSSQDERFPIHSITGDRFNLKGELQHDHERVDGHPFHIVNLTRNLVLRSEQHANARDRGHVMFRNRDVHIENVLFQNLGRTDKRVPLDDILVRCLDSGGTIKPCGHNPNTNPLADYDIVVDPTSLPVPQPVTNRRGRYAVHFHQNGAVPGAATPPSKVYGSVVDGTLGWGFVNHSSHVDFQRNVAYDFAGAGFVTESGDELGRFLDNVAIRGTGNGQYRPARVVFQNPERPQPLSDFAFSGDGFWFQGPALEVRGNIASGCDGAGMIWFTTGAPDIAQTFTTPAGRTHNRYTHFPRGWLDAVYGIGHGLVPRHWEHSVTNEKLVASDLPILDFSDFTAYGNLVGFRLRFNNHDNIDWYIDRPFRFDTHVEIVCGGSNRCATRNRQALDRMTLWNNEQAFRMRYAKLTDWTDVEADNRLSYGNPASFRGVAGGEFNFQVQNHTFTRLAVDGYPVAGWIQKDANDNVRPLITFVTPPDYRNYANRDTWIRGSGDPLFIPCNRPTNVVVSAVTSSSATVAWTASPNNVRYLVRVKPTADQPWTHRRTTATSINLTGLDAGTPHSVQVMAGCSAGSDERNVSSWTNAVAFATNP